MDIIISNSDGRPIYEQIMEQVKGHILNGRLQGGDALPSIRLLAKELRISVITTKRAYDELEHEGYIVTTPGKGSFVADKNPQLMREERLRIAEGHLSAAVDTARASGIGLEELQDILRLLYQG